MGLVVGAATAIAIVVAVTFCAGRNMPPTAVSKKPSKVLQKTPISSDRDMVMTSWSDVPGAKLLQEGVQISAVDRKIVNQDGSGGQLDPPINIGGQYVSFTKEMSLRVRMTAATASGYQTLRLYSQPPIIYDEWRWEPASVGISILGSRLLVQNYSGQKEKPDVRDYAITPASSYDLDISGDGKSLAITINGKLVALQSNSELFSTKQLWFGATTSTSWNLISVTIPESSDAQFKTAVPAGQAALASNGLAALMNPKQKLIGAAVSLNPLIADPKYQSVALREFSQFTTENELKAQFVHPAPSDYQFGRGDLLVRIAKQNNKAIHGHALVFGEANPLWMQTTKPVQMETVMKDHVSTIVGHYKDSIAEWDVINEPLSDNDADYANDGNGLRRHIWYRAMGESYIEKALRAARSASPGAKLYINDYGLEEDGDRWDSLLSLISRLQAKGVPLDGIGFESHIYEVTDHESSNLIVSHMKQLKNLGLLVRISEIDVHGENQAVQSQQYGAVLKACLVSANCTSYTTWGITDRYGSTTSDHSYPLEYGDDLLWNEMFKPKPAYTNISKILQG